VLAPGTRLGPYEVLAPLGAGGMGEVYRARDTRLDRSVALKVLPHALSADADARARLIREARTVSSLNHPHICTLYDVGHEAGLDYLVMEHLEGETLAHRLGRGAMPTPELLRCAVEVSDALDAAHRRGVIHRDLKPGNIMLTKSGAKLLDFGLARTVGLSPTVSAESESPTLSSPITAEGAIVGTFQYMAPEQLEGREADARTDIFSFGSVLYEMATGRKAFEGRSQASLIAAILERQPPPLTTVAPLAPPALERIVQRCLAKDPDERWQTARDLNHELKWILDDSSKSGVAAPAAGRVPPAPSPRARMLVMIIATVAAAVIGPVAFRAVQNRPPRINPDMSVRILPLSLLQIGYPGMAPDGKWIALGGGDAGGHWGLYFMNLRGGEPKQVLTAEGGLPILYADVSPDGGQIAYTQLRQDGNGIRIVPSLGGPSVEVARNGDGPHWRPDGQRVGYMVHAVFAASRKLELWSVRPDGSDRRLEYVDSLSTGRGRFCFAWSPDGQRIAWLRSFAGETYQELIVRDLKSGRERQITHDHRNIDEVWWTRQDEIVFSSNRAGSTNLWIIRASGGAPVRITKGVGADIGMRVSADGRTLLYLQRQEVRHLWVGDLVAGTAQEVTHEDLGLGGPSISPDGRTIAVPIFGVDPLRRVGDLYLMDRDGGHRRRLDLGPLTPVNCSWARDGRRLAVVARPTGSPLDSNMVYIVDTNGGDPPRRMGPGSNVIWTSDTTLSMGLRNSTYLISTLTGRRSMVSLDSTFVFPVPLGGVVTVDLRSGHQGLWKETAEEAPVEDRPAAAGRATRRLLAPIDLPVSIGSAYEVIYSTSPGKISRVVYATGRREPIPGTFPDFTVASTGSVGWNRRDIVYLAPGVTSKLVLVENLR